MGKITYFAELPKIIQPNFERYLWVLFGDWISGFCFMFITGIVNFKNTGILSAIKGLADISMDPEYGSIVGFTTQELKDYFSG